MVKRLLVVLLVLGVQYHAFANQVDNEETSRFILFLGRFHPLVLHLPIGALIITFYLDVVGRIRNNYPKKTIQLALGFSSVFAIIASILGYFLSLEGGYNKESLDIHFWTGILTAVLITVLFFICKSTQKKIKQIFFPFFVLTIVSMSIAGHYGSVLTHGDNFIFEYATAKPKEKIITNVDSLKFYNDVIAKILDDKCVQCHNSTKKKGDLSLISRATILKGGENGKIVHANEALNSSLYTNTLLPLSDDLHMPPEGKPQLTKNELWLLNYWIDNDLDFNSKMSKIKSNDTLNNLLVKYLVFEKINIPFAKQSDVIKIKNAGFNVYRLVPDKPELSVKYLGANLKKTDIKLLTNLKKQIVELDLSNTNANDDVTNVLIKMKRLIKLRLDNTLITDKSLEYIKGLKSLNFLNLHNTQITNSGLEKLLQQVVPQNIYCWNTNVDDAFVEVLERNYNVSISNGVFESFIEKVPLRAPSLLTNKTLFVDTVSVGLESKMKDVIIRYTFDDSEPNESSLIYSEPILLKENTTIKYKAYKEGWFPSETLYKDFTKAGIKIKNYTIDQEPDQRYPKSSKLFDFEEGTVDFRDGKWAGFNGNDIITYLDLGEPKTMTNVSVSCLEHFKDYILFPKKLIVYSAESKGAKYKKLGEMKINSHGVGSVGILKRFTLNFRETKGQYFKIVVENSKVLPSTHPAAGEKSWMFVDEITIQ